MKNSPFKKLLEKKWLFIIIAVILIIAVIAIALVLSRNGSDKNTSDDKNISHVSDDASDDKTPSSNTPADVSGSAADGEQQGLLSIEDAPEPTLGPEALDTTVEENDPAPEVLLKQNQQTFNECMEANDYDGAKKVLDSYFASSEFALGDTSTRSTYDNYVYYYEKQGLYEESAKWQIDFLDKEMGLDNITESNIRYKRLLETLQYVRIDDPRLETMKNSIQRWKEIDELLANSQIDTAIEKLQGYIENGLQECVYAYHYIAKAYGEKPDYFKQARTYYIFLTRLSAREPNTLERSFQPVFLEHAYALYDMYKISDEERDLMQDTITADSLP